MEDYVETLISKLRSRQARERWEAALRLSETRDLRALKPLQHALNDRNINVRINASWALGLLGPAALPSLFQALRTNNQNIRTCIPFALTEIRLPEAHNALLACLHDENTIMRVQAIQALAFFPCEETLAAIQNLLDDPVENVRFFAELTLERLQDPQWVRYILSHPPIEQLPIYQEWLEDNSL